MGEGETERYTKEPGTEADRQKGTKKTSEAKKIEKRRKEKESEKRRK